MHLPRSCFLISLCCLVIGSSVNSQENLYTQMPEVLESKSPNEGAAIENVITPTPEKDRLAAVPEPAWIWGPDQDKPYLLKRSFSSSVPEGRLKATCDNEMTLKLNGRTIATSSNWESPIEVDVSEYLIQGENLLEAIVGNRGGIAAFGLQLGLFESADSDSVGYIITDKNWRAAETGTDRFRPAKVVRQPGKGPWVAAFRGRGSAPSTDRKFNTLPGFQVERIFTVPKSELGSWVCITLDPKGRILASDQGDQGICRITPSPIGSRAPTKVEHLDLEMTSAQGMLSAFDSLYFSVNGGPGSGIYRARDTDGDDQYDEVEKIRAFHGGGEHGPHALRRSPDGESIYVICGNHTDPVEFDSSRVPSNWGEDLLLPRQWDARGHARGKLAPGGWIAKTDPDGETWEIISVGYRNAYDMDFNAEGELFAYDADMEWDFGTPWYRPTRVVHATSGSEFGWRSGTGKWPTYYPDSLPPMVDIGPGSPVGVGFGYGSKFPAKYQRALFILDWTFGTIYAIHLEPSGASYTAKKEEFVSRTPLPLTDMVIGGDGAMYFSVGGRGTQSELFRVTYVGDESTDPASLTDSKGAELRSLRRSIEAHHDSGSETKAAVGFCWPYLGHTDRHIRYAARVALEHQGVSAWKDRMILERNPQILISAAIALARQGDKSLQPEMMLALGKINFAKLDEAQKLELLRALQLMFIRMGKPTTEGGAAISRMLNRFYPSGSANLDRELCNMLVYLESPQVVEKTMTMMATDYRGDTADLGPLLKRNPRYGKTIAKMVSNQPDVQRIHYAFALRNMKSTWTPPQRLAYFEFLREARGWSGGASYEGFLDNIGNDAFDNATDVERLLLEASGARAPYKIPEIPKPRGPGENWTLQRLLAEQRNGMSGRDFNNGKRSFAAARCILCHRFGGDGGATGPDLTQAAGRFSYRDLCEAIVEPSKVISDQYVASIVELQDGQIVSGRIATEDDDSITILLDPEDASKVQKIAKSDITSNEPSKTSVMPGGLLNSLSKNEVLDLLAYLLTRGNPDDPVFEK